MEVDKHSAQKSVLALAPAALAANTNGISINTKGYESLEYHIAVGTAFVGGGFNVTLEEDVDDGAGSPAGTWAAVPAANILGALPSIAIADANTAFRVGSIGKKQWQRIVVTETGTITGGVIGAIGVLGDPKHGLVDDQST